VQPGRGVEFCSRSGQQAGAKTTPACSPTGCHHATAPAASAAAAPVRPGRAAAAAAGSRAFAGAAPGNSLARGTGVSAWGGWQLRYERKSGCTCAAGGGEVGSGAVQLWMHSRHDAAWGLRMEAIGSAPKQPEGGGKQLWVHGLLAGSGSPHQRFASQQAGVEGHSVGLHKLLGTDVRTQYGSNCCAVVLRAPTIGRQASHHPSCVFAKTKALAAAALALNLQFQRGTAVTGVSTVHGHQYGSFTWASLHQKHQQKPACPRTGTSGA